MGANMAWYELQTLIKFQQLAKKDLDAEIIIEQLLDLYEDFTILLLFKPIKQEITTGFNYVDVIQDKITKKYYIRKYKLKSIWSYDSGYRETIVKKSFFQEVVVRANKPCAFKMIHCSDDCEDQDIFCDEYFECNFEYKNLGDK